MFESKFFTWITSLEHPLLHLLTTIINLISHDYFYIIISAILFWAFHKQIGFMLIYLVTGSMYTHILLNDLFNITGPSSSNIQEYSFPNGPTQITTTFLGYTATLFSRKPYTILALILILLTAFIQLHIGFHWPIDIFGALLIGSFLVYLANRTQDWIGSMPDLTKLILAIALPMALMFLSPISDLYSGLLLGLGLGYLLEQIKIRMVIANQPTKKLLACVIGLMGVVGIYYIGLLLPDLFLVQFLHATLLGVWITLIAPMLFVSLSIYRQTGTRIEF